MYQLKTNKEEMPILKKDVTTQIDTDHDSTNMTVEVKDAESNILDDSNEKNKVNDPKIKENEKN